MVRVRAGHSVSEEQSGRIHRSTWMCVIVAVVKTGDAKAGFRRGETEDEVLCVWE